MPNEPNICVLRTHLTVAQVVDALRSSMDYSDLSFRFGVGCKGNRKFIGNVEANRCRMMRRPRFLANSAGIFEATIFEEKDATRLDGTFTNPEIAFNLDKRIHSPYPSGHDIAILVAVAISLFLGYSFLRSLIDEDFAFFNQNTIVAIAGLAIDLLIAVLSERIQRGDRRYILDHVQSVLHATEHS